MTAIARIGHRHRHRPHIGNHSSACEANEKKKEEDEESTSKIKIPSVAYMPCVYIIPFGLSASCPSTLVKPRAVVIHPVVHARALFYIRQEEIKPKDVIAITGANDPETARGAKCRARACSS